jgi:hypothetical protein
LVTVLLSIDNFCKSCPANFLLSKGTPAALVYGLQYARPISFLSSYYDGDYAKEATITSYSPPTVYDSPYPHWHISYADLEISVGFSYSGKDTENIVETYSSTTRMALIASWVSIVSTLTASDVYEAHVVLLQEDRS